MRIFLFVLLNAFIFVSCTFHPEGDHFVEVEPVTSGTFKIDLTNHGDTIYLSKTIDVTFELDLEDKNAQFVQVKVDGEEYKSLVPPNNSFNLLGNNYSTGFHELEFVIYSNTGSGSLADRIGQEHLVASVFFILYVDIDPPHKIQITKFENEGGRLKISWEKYERPNFIKYVLNRGSSITSPNSFITTIEDANINYAYDDSYVGGNEKYWIEIYAYSPGLSSPAVGKDTIINLHPPEILSVTNDSPSSQVIIKWDTCKYTQAFDSYHIRANAPGNRYYDPTQSPITDIDVTSTSFDELPFGGPLDIIFSVRSKEVNRAYDTLEYHIGEKTNPYYFLDYNPGFNRYYRVYNDTMYMYGDGISEMKTILPDYGNSYFDEVFVRDNYVYLLLGTKLYKYSSLNLDYLETIDLQDIVGTFEYPEYSSMTANGIFAFRKINLVPPNTYDTLKVIDIETGTELFSNNWLGYYPNYAISIDGRFLYNNKMIYEWNGNDYVLVNGNPNLGGEGDFHTRLGSEITGNYQVLSLFTNSSTGKFDCIKYDILNDEIKETISFNGGAQYYSFDMVHDAIYIQAISEFENPAICIIRDTGTEGLEQIEVANLDNVKYRYLNDTVYSSTGFKQYHK